MGRHTWESIPLHKRPLKNRINVILSKTLHILDMPNISTVHDFDDLDVFIKNNKDKNNIFIIGGQSIYKYYINQADRIYATVVFKSVDCDTFFPTFEYKLIEESQAMFSEDEKCHFIYKVFERMQPIS